MKYSTLTIAFSLLVNYFVFSQNVGIGTAIPLYPLTIQTPSNVGSWGTMHTNGTVNLGSFIYPSGIAEFGTRTNHPLYLFTNNADAPPAIALSATGNYVGINTTNPQQQLDIHGNNTAIKFTDNTSGNVALISRYTNRLEILTGDIFQVAIGTTGNPSFLINSSGNIGIGDNTPLNRVQIGTPAGFSGNDLAIGNNGKGMSFYQSSTASIWYSNANFSLMPNGGSGNVGIGTLNPTYKLSVLGNIRATEIVVETGWADYVFDEDYKLKSLDSVEKSIIENKHLPGIPSAKYIQENGLKVGEVQTKMMEKIEELTLYLIEADKRIEKLEKQIPSHK